MISHYQGKLVCLVSTLLVHEKSIPIEIMEQKVNNADIIYVGGGDTLSMMRRWKQIQLDSILRQTHMDGKILSGVSAGGICWFDSGHSDSMSFTQKDWEYIRVSGLGLIDAIHCPHYDSATEEKPRRQYFHDFMKKLEQQGSIGIAIDEKVAVEWTDN